jgi:hypothetical protein
MQNCPPALSSTTILGPRNALKSSQEELDVFVSRLEDWSTSRVSLLVHRYVDMRHLLAIQRGRKGLTMSHSIKALV